MRNILDRLRHNIKTHVFCSITFVENPAVYEIVSKKCWNQRDDKWRHNMAHKSCMLDKQGYMHARSGTRPSARVHAGTRARARAQTHTHKCVKRCFSTAAMITWSPLNVTLYVHCLSCLLILYRHSGKWVTSKKAGLVFSAHFRTTIMRNLPNPKSFLAQGAVA